MSNLRYQKGVTVQQDYSEGKLAAYYTDLNHCGSLSGLFNMPDGEEVCVLEPSIGDGSAVIACTKADENPNIRIFGVELNEAVADQTKLRPEIEDLLPCDFTNGVQIKNQAFSFCFGNPPYMDDDEGEFKERLEKVFLERVSDKYLKKGGILVWVIPYYIFSESAYLRLLMNRYDFLGVWKFRPEEYKKYHQVVFVGRRRQNRLALISEIKEVAARYDDIEKIEELPLTFEGTDLYHSIDVEPTRAADVTLFAPIVFDVEGAFRYLCSNPSMDDYHKLVSAIASQKEFKATDIGKPPIPLKKDSLYLMATSGAGQGFAGEKGKDLHLQRGVAEIVEHIEYEDDPSDPDGEGLMKVTSHTSITMTIIETSGKITRLE